MVAHLTSLQQGFDKYWGPENEILCTKEWIRDPFKVDADSVDLPVEMREKLIDLSNDLDMKCNFDDFGRAKFWCRLLKSEFNELARNSIATLLFFPSRICVKRNFG